MKRLVSAKDVVAAAARHEDIYVDENTIVTAQAKGRRAGEGRTHHVRPEARGARG